MRAGRVTERLTQATILAQDQLEEFRAEFEPFRDGSDACQAGSVRSWRVSFI